MKSTCVGVLWIIKLKRHSTEVWRIPPKTLLTFHIHLLLQHIQKTIT